MPRIFLLLFFSWTFQSVTAQIGSVELQDKPFVINVPKDTSIWNQLEANHLFRTLSQQEQWFFYWANWLRKDPARFYKVVVRSFLKQFPEANTRDLIGLDQQLFQIKAPLPPFMPDSGLFQMSRIHAIDLNRQQNELSHTSSSGKSFEERIKAAGDYNCAGENVYYGVADPLVALTLLLIDYGVPGRGHRLNLLSSEFERLGLSFISISENTALIVQDFACK